MDRNRSRRTTLGPDEAFVFSQSALQDYAECQRRFQLRYLQQVRWPAPQTEPIQENEQHIQRGERFHRLAQQALLGVPLERLDAIVSADNDEALPRWWRSFTALLPTLTPPEAALAVETRLGAPFQHHRLIAQYDLVQVFSAEKRAVIWDWKTSLKRPRRAWLEARLQSIVYPYIFARSSAGLNQGTAFQPEQIEMVYWFAEFPEQPERFVYDTARYQRAEARLLALVSEIESLRADQFEKTPDEKACRFCVYRSLCARGSEAGSLAELESDLETPGDIEINFDQIGEIRF
jgi:hypothetical protein